MVKADPKHDYYADLEVPAMADAETIKKQFRLLAKQYHPDRNPGREIEVIPKFQAIQAAHEILSDPVQKRSYDRDRAKENSSYDTPGVSTFKKPAKPPPPPSNFPPPPKRNPNPPKPPFGASNTRHTSSASAEKFAPFARAAPQQWDRAKFEDAAKAETLRNLNNMRGQSQGPPPRVPPRAAPTATRPQSTAPSPDIPYKTGTNPGFPGLSRTNSGRRGGFTPNTPGSDEPPAPSSAYAYVHRPPPPFPYPPSASKNGASASPSSQRTRPSMSPLRPVKSSGFEEVQRPGLSRTSSRYATHSGERTDINGPGLTRSASVRNSPTAQHWDESGPFGRRPQSQQHGTSRPPPPRHHSSSPRRRAAKFEFSGSEPTSSEDEQTPSNDNRPKATPRRNQPPPATTSPHATNNEPALTASFQFGNYNTAPTDEKSYQYPPPEPNDAQNRRKFEDLSSSVEDITQGLNRSGIRHVHRDDVPLTNQSSQRPNGTTSETQAVAPNANNTFTAADWDGKFANGENVFRPPESTSRSKSPNKTPRPKLPNRNKGVSRSQGEKESDGSAGDEGASSIPGVRHVPGTGERETKAAAFQPGKFSAEDWAQRLRGQCQNKPPKVPPRDKASPNIAAKQPQVHDEVEVEESPSSPEKRVPLTHRATGPDPMEIDESVPQQAPPNGNPNNAQPASDPTSPRPASSGVNLSELNNTAPFRPSATGLADLDDLGNSLPFDSRAAEELNLHQAPSFGLAAHHLRLPPPPKPVLPPDEAHLDQESWSAYAHKMTQYMDAWSIFNCKMIDHFRVRQQQIHLAMYHNWVTAIGDGAAADDFEGLDYVGMDPTQANGADIARSKPKKAGYATYMEWLKQDRMCRTWWEVAFEEHTKCMEDLGVVRKMIKAISVRESRKAV